MELPKNDSPEDAYSLDKMTASTKMCLERSLLIWTNKIMLDELSLLYMSDKKYIKANTISWWGLFEVGIRFAVGTFIISFGLTVILEMFGRSFPKFLEPIVFTMMSFWVISFPILYRTCDIYRIKRSAAFSEYRAKRENLDKNMVQMGLFQMETEEKIYDLENEMRNPKKCIIPEPYWNCAAELLQYIINSRANNLTEAIKVYQMEHKEQKNNWRTS